MESWNFILDQNFLEWWVPTTTDLCVDFGSIVSYIFAPGEKSEFSGKYIPDSVGGELLYVSSHLVKSQNPEESMTGQGPADSSGIGASVPVLQWDAPDTLPHFQTFQASFLRTRVLSGPGNSVSNSMKTSWLAVDRSCSKPVKDILTQYRKGSKRLTQS